MADITVPGTQSAIKGLVGRKISKTVKFIDADLKITKLSVAQIKELQTLSRESTKANAAEGAPEDDGLGIVKWVIRTAVEGADQLTDEDFTSFSMDDLTKLTGEIMAYSGVGEAGN